MSRADEARTEPRASAAIVSPVRRLSALEKTVGVLRAILPVAQKVLPLIDGQIGTVVSNLMGPQISPRQITQTLLPLQEGLAQLEKRHIELRALVAGQAGAFKEIDEQLKTLKKLAEETAEKQRKTAEDVEKMRHRLTAIAIGGLLLLAALAAFDGVLFVHLRPFFK
ncbi:MAG TPA: hypothetical protein VL986_06345 [Terracidiphilus sp.]|nr:hypothetical protein [Terracidiphilus sp.]